jgi:hypothetical protein
MVLLHGVRNQEDQLLRPNADAVSILECGAADERPTVELSAIAAVKVFQRWLRSGKIDSNVPTRQHRIVDRHLAQRASAHDDLVACEVDLLQMKPQTISQARNLHESSG